jgi:hypothetical protein
MYQICVFDHICPFLSSSNTNTTDILSDIYTFNDMFSSHFQRYFIKSYFIRMIRVPSEHLLKSKLCIEYPIALCRFGCSWDIKLLFFFLEVTVNLEGVGTLLANTSSIWLIIVCNVCSDLLR